MITTFRRTAAAAAALLVGGAGVRRGNALSGPRFYADGTYRCLVR
jgi:hypothetical protein